MKRTKASLPELPQELLAVPSRCRCGCKRRVPASKPGKRARLFAKASCRSRFMRARKATAGLAVRLPWKAAKRRTAKSHGKTPLLKAASG